MLPGVETSPELLARYEIIERGPPGRATGVLRPVDESQLQAMLAACNAQGVPVVISAGRTGLVEAQRPDGDLVLSLERLNRPLSVQWADGSTWHFPPELPPAAWRDALFAAWEAMGRPDSEGMTITVQAGLAIDALNELLEPLGRMFPMEMGSSSAATVGGAAANASAGSNAICYGTAAHMTDCAWGLWGDATAAGPFSGPRWQTPDPDRLAIDSSTLHEDWGLLGSQGVFGIITRLRLRTFAIPRQREAALVALPDMPAAARLFAQARSVFGDAIEEYEFMSRSSIELVRELRGDALRLPFDALPEVPYLVLLQLRSDDPDADLAGALYGFLSETAGIDDASIGYGPLPVVKALRHSITESSNARMRKLGGGRLSFDTATPIACFGDYLDTLDRELRRDAPDLEFVAFGHAGVGGAHLHLLGSAAHPVKAVEQSLVDRVIDVTLTYHGTFSAEHGIGPKWGAEYQARKPEAERVALRAAKQRHDPNGILNPRSFGLDRQ